VQRIQVSRKERLEEQERTLLLKWKSRMTNVETPDTQREGHPGLANVSTDNQK
jgi:hypothetical protein